MNPPLGSVVQPFLALASLQGHLRANGCEDVTIHDISQEIVCRLLTRDRAGAIADEVDRATEQHEAQPVLSARDAMRYEALVLARVDARWAADEIDHAVQALRSPEAFHDLATYERSMAAVDAVFSAVSAVHFPQVLTRHHYVADQLHDLEDEPAVLGFLDDPDRCLFRADLEDGIVERLCAVEAEVIGLSATFPDQFLPALVVARMVKARRPDVHIVLGGAFVSARLDRILTSPWLFDVVDSMVVHEGETALLGLVRALERELPISLVPNLVHAAHGRVRPPAVQHTEALDQLAAPDYTGYDIGRYLAPSWDVIYDPTRGCYWGKCTFCAISLSTRGAGARSRQPTVIVDHLEQLCEQRATDVVTFGVDAIPVPLMRDVCEEILRRGLSIGWSSEFTLAPGLDRPTIELFAAAGCLLLLFGFESASPRLLRSMKKGTHPDRTEQIVNDCHDVGITVLLHLMIGFPGETADDAAATVRWIEDHRDAVDLVELACFGLAEGAPVLDDPSAAGLGHVGRLKRPFERGGGRSFAVGSGLGPAAADRLVRALGDRLDRALGLADRRFLRTDDAHLHLALRQSGARPRDLAGSTDRVATDPFPVRSPFDLGELSTVLDALRHQVGAGLAETERTTEELWSKLAEGLAFERGPGFACVVDRRAHRLIGGVPTGAVSDDELQAESERFRRELGLLRASDLHDWLSARRWSLEDLETFLEVQVSAPRPRSR